MCPPPYQNKQPTQRAPKLGARLAHMLALTMPRLVLAPGHVSKLFGWCCFGYSAPNGAAISHQFAPPHCKNVQCAHAPQMPQAHAGWAGNWPSARAPPPRQHLNQVWVCLGGPLGWGAPINGGAQHVQFIRVQFVGICVHVFIQVPATPCWCAANKWWHEKKLGLAEGG